MSRLDLGSRASEQPDTPAVVMGSSGQTVTYGQLDERSNRLARLLRAHGLVEGDHLAILMDNDPRYLEVAWAAQRSGLYYTALNQPSVGRRGPVHPRRLRGDRARRRGRPAGGRGRPGPLGGTGPPLGGGDLEGFERYEDPVGTSSRSPWPTSPKVARCSTPRGPPAGPRGCARRWAAPPWGTRPRPRSRSPAFMSRSGAGPGAVYLSPAPLYHSAPLVYSMSMLRFGATVVVMERFDPAECLALIERHRVTHAQFVPTMFVRLLKLAPAERQAPRPLEPALRRPRRRPLPGGGQAPDARVVGPDHPRVLLGHRGHRGDLDHPRGMAGPPRLGRVPDEPGPHRRARRRRSGTRRGGGDLLRGRAAASSTTTTRTRRRRSPTATGGGPWATSAGSTHDGYLYLTDRASHMIIAGGVNIYPQEAENVLASHPAVADVAVFGVPDAEMGEAVKAVVELVDPALGGPGLEADLIAYCRAALAAYKCPRSVDFVDELPRDPNGKLYKRLLKDRYWSGHESRVL